MDTVAIPSEASPFWFLNFLALREVDSRLPVFYLPRFGGVIVESI